MSWPEDSNRFRKAPVGVSFKDEGAMASNDDPGRNPEQRPSFLSPQEFGQLSGLSLATVHRYLKRGCLPYRQPSGRRGRILIPRDALDLTTSTGLRPGDDTLPPSSLSATSSSPDIPGRLSGTAPRWSKQADLYRNKEI